MPVVTLSTTGVFAGYDLGDLRALVLRMLRQGSPVRYSPTAATTDYDWIDDSLNRGQDDFVRMTKCLKNYAIIELKANQRLYRLPEDLLDISAAYYYDSSLATGYKQLIFTSIAELNDEVSDWRTDKDTPERCYLDRNYGQGQTIGLYPIPDTDGTVPVFTSDYGTAVTWVCPLYVFNQDVGVIIRISGEDEWILSTDTGVAVDAQIADYNMFLEYFRLPQELTDAADDTQKTEVPREYQKALAYYATADLLSNNPEDSAEFKRAEYFRQLYAKEIATYINRQKRAPTARMLRTRSHVWNWQQDMQYYKEMA